MIKDFFFNANRELHNYTITCNYTVTNIQNESSNLPLMTYISETSPLVNIILLFYHNIKSNILKMTKNPVYMCLEPDNSEC